MYADVTASNTGRIRFVYSFDDDGLTFDGYLTEEQAIGAMGAIHHQPVEISPLTTSTVRSNVRFFIIKVTNGRRQRIRTDVTAGESI